VAKGIWPRGRIIGPRGLSPCLRVPFTFASFLNYLSACPLVSSVWDARALDGKLKPHVRIDFLNRGDDLPGDRGARCERSACVALTGHAEASQQRIDFGE
jgi:hypothetical protein